VGASVLVALGSTAKPTAAAPAVVAACTPAQTVTITSSAGTGGTVAPPSVTACPGDTFSFTATPSTGWAVDHWNAGVCAALTTCAGTAPTPPPSSFNVSVAFKDVAPPSTPSGLAVSSNTCTAVTVTWNASTDNDAVASYSTYQNTAYAGSTTSTSMTFSSGLACSTTYTFGVAAIDAAGNGSSEGSITVTTPSAAAPPPTTTTTPTPPPAPPPTTTTTTTTTTSTQPSNSSGGDTTPAATSPDTTTTATAAFQPVVAVTAQPSQTAHLPTVLAKLSVAVSGAGTVKGASGIVCSGDSARCFGTFKPGTKLQLKAGPRAGFQFTGWSGGCSGAAIVCVISIKKDAEVKATFAPFRTTSIVPVSIDKAAFAVDWTESVGSGTLELGGRIGHPASVSITLHRSGASKPLLTEHLSLPAGKFNVSLSLAPGKLPSGAVLYPGTYVVSLAGKGGKGTIPPQVKPVTLTAPATGVVSKAFASGSAQGAAVASLKGVKSIWAHFYYQTQPGAKLPITIAWYEPNGKLAGQIREANRPDVSCRVGSSGPLPKGAWRADLRSGTTVVKSITVQVT
jgi:hypothetical protein